MKQKGEGGSGDRGGRGMDVACRAPRTISWAVFFYHNCYWSRNLIGKFAVVDKSPDNAARAFVNVSRSWSRFEKPELLLFF